MYSEGVCHQIQERNSAYRASRSLDLYSGVLEVGRGHKNPGKQQKYTMSARGAKKRQKSLSKSVRAGVLFPVGRMRRYLRGITHHLRIGAGAPVYLAAVIEYLTGKWASATFKFHSKMTNSRHSRDSCRKYAYQIYSYLAGKWLRFHL